MLSFPAISAALSVPDENGASAQRNPELSKNLQTRIQDKRGEMYSVDHWNDTFEKGRAAYAVELIEMLVMSGKYTVRPDGKSDMQEAKELCERLLLTGKEQPNDGISGFIPARSRSMSKAYLAMIYLANINEKKANIDDPATGKGKGMSVVQYAIRLCKEAYAELYPSAASQGGGNSATSGVRRLRTSAGASSEELPYYLIFNTRITEAKLNYARKGSAGFDKTTADIYEGTMKVNLSELNITGPDEQKRRRTVNGITWLQIVARIERAAFYKFELNPERVQTGIDLLNDAIRRIDDLEDRKMTSIDRSDIHLRGESLPRESYDSKRARLLLAELNARKAMLAGEDETALLQEIIRLGPEGGTIEYALALAKLGDRINRSGKNYQNLERAREYLCMALDILDKKKWCTELRNKATGEEEKRRIVDGALRDHINLIKAPNSRYGLDRSVVETLCMLAETEVKLFVLDVRSGRIKKDKRQDEWANRYGLIHDIRGIVRNYIDKGLKLWRPGFNVRDMKDIIDTVVKGQDKDLAKRLRESSIWRAELIWAGCIPPLGIMSAKACSIASDGDDFRLEDIVENSPNARY